MDRKGAVQYGNVVLVPEERPLSTSQQQQSFDLKHWHEVPNTHQHDYGIVTEPEEGYKHRRRVAAANKIQDDALSPFERMILELEHESKPGRTEQQTPAEEQQKGIEESTAENVNETKTSSGQNGPKTLLAAAQSKFTMRLVRRRGTNDQSGVGISLIGSNYSPGFFIYSVDPEGPAGKSCLVHVGDALLAVDDVICEGLSGSEVVKLISGEPGTWVELTLIPAVKLVPITMEMSPFKEESEQRCVVVCPSKGIGQAHRSLGILVEKRLPIRQHQVIYIDPEGPVAKSRRVRVGDTIVKVDGEPVEAMRSEDVNKLLAEDVDRPLLLTLGERPLPVSPMPPLENDRDGRYVVTLDPREEEPGSRIGLTVGVEGGTKNVVVLDIEDDTPASRTQKLATGDVVLRVDGVDVHSLADGALPQLMATNWKAGIPIELYMRQWTEQTTNPRIEVVVFRAAGGGAWSGGMRQGGIGAMLERVESGGEEVIRISDFDAEGPLGLCSHKLKAGAVLEAVDEVPLARKSDAEIAELVGGDVGSAVLLSFADHNPDFVARAPNGQSRWRMAVAREKLGGGSVGIGCRVAYNELLLCYQFQDVAAQGPLGRSRRVLGGDLLLSVDGIALGYKNKSEVDELLGGLEGSFVVLTLGRIERRPDEAEGGAHRGLAAEGEEDDDEGWIEDEVGWGDPIGGLIKAVERTLGKPSAAPSPPMSA